MIGVSVAAASPLPGVDAGPLAEGGGTCISIEAEPGKNVNFTVQAATSVVVSPAARK